MIELYLDQDTEHINIEARGHAVPFICTSISYATQAYINYTLAHSLHCTASMEADPAANTVRTSIQAPTTPELAIILDYIIISMRSIAQQYPEELKVHVLSNV